MSVLRNSTQLRPLASALRRPAAAATATTAPRCTVASKRFKSGPYGYTQAKALVFAKEGEPADVLKVVPS